MPCTSEGYNLPPTPTVLKKDYDKLLAEHDKVTRILCGVIGQIRKGDLHKFLDEEGELWYEKHQKIDAKRLANEKKQAKIKELEAQIAKLKGDL